MPWFPESIVDYAPSGSEYGLIVRPLGAGTGGAVRVELSGSNTVSVSGTLPVTGSVWSYITTNGTTPLGTNDNPFIVSPNGSIIDAGNSTTTLLTASGVWTGVATEVIHFSQMMFVVYSDHDGTIYVDMGQDGTNWDYTYTDGVTGGTLHFDSLPFKGRYYRIRYVNGNQAQGVFRLQTILKTTPMHGRIIELEESPKDDDIVELSRAVITGRSASGGGTYVNVKVDPAGKLLTSVDPAGGSTWVVSASSWIPTVTGTVILNPASHVNIHDDHGGQFGVDPFGRARVGSAHTLADLIMRYEIDTRDWGQMASGSAVISYLPNEQAALLSASSLSASFAILQTNQYYRYQAGKAQWIRLTCTHGDTGQTDQVRRWGYFDQDNGLFFQLAGTTLQVVRRTSTSGTPVDNVVAQSAWNGDKMNGTGQSGVTIDITKGNIWEIEFQSLAVGNVYFRINGILVHTMRHPNTLTVPYTQTAQLPARFEIRNLAATTGAWIKPICASVESHGGTPPPQEVFGAPATPVDISVTTTEVPILAVRLKSTYGTKDNRMIVLPKLLSVSSASAAARWRILINPTTLTQAGGAAPTWTSVDARSGCEFATNAAVFTGGQQLHAKTMVGTNGQDQTIDISSFFDEEARCLRLDAFASTSDVILITGVKSSAGSTNMRASLTWTEIR